MLPTIVSFNFQLIPTLPTQQTKNKDIYELFYKHINYKSVVIIHITSQSLQ